MSVTPQSFCSPSSSTSSCSKMNYEVFLSFHGNDVRTNFADHLYNALVGSGIQTFRDSEELQKGNKIEEELFTAIQQSKISIPIFSENYASSKWCLKELTHICECRRTLDQIVMPIFYKIEPRDVRGQKRKYEEAFKQHQINMVSDVQKWKNAMKEVGELDGWHVKNETFPRCLKFSVVKIQKTDDFKMRAILVVDDHDGMQY